MADLSAARVKELRDRTGAGMMDCKKALTATEGDMEAAVDWLRTKGLAAAQKKSSRTAAEGLVGVATAGLRGAAVEVNAETDFVARNDRFQGFVRTVTQIALEAGDDVETILAQPYPGGDGSVRDMLTANVATIGENQTVRRAALVEVAEGHIASYVHNAAADGMGKIGVLVALESPAAKDALDGLGRQLAMHVAAAFPTALTEADVDPALLERERAIATEKAQGSGKPAEIIAKMVDGGVRKFAAEQAFLSQVFVIDGKSKVSDVVAAEAKKIGHPIRVTAFVRFQLGEGIDKGPETDFAAEVAKAAGG